ncbi:hypothetical protein [Klebsiella pneumoniae]|uniref:hypothetical protein n=1 Tax=Klebsiella pneumoniae TaxID=573 RepID=UPI000E2CD8F4|nr:hypothetical protein [Klebsiella pneumoniae]SXJ56580.1 Uncharacterised protein [Klebsiella pneumoniae]SXP56248.1 Uncharacterised protein [Klebsiella pneumoniae]HBR7873732.1 hypothetical protein [Klebsiella pneumoniae]HBS7109469.1 hypothetical protein [Klebsiella pneumoniae]
MARMIRLASDHYVAATTIDDMHIDCNRQVKVLLNDGRIVFAEQGYGQTAWARLAQLVDEVNMASVESDD